MTKPKIDPLAFSPSLPEDGDAGHYFGFSADGDAFVLQWHPETLCWGAVGYVAGRPMVKLLQGNDAGFITTTLRQPLATLPKAEAEGAEAA